MKKVCDYVLLEGTNGMTPRKRRTATKLGGFIEDVVEECLRDQKDNDL